MPGDLSLPLLGIEPSLYELLANTVDVIVHNGKRNTSECYLILADRCAGALAAAVQGSKSCKRSWHTGSCHDEPLCCSLPLFQEALRLAITGKLKRVHYISTTSVYDTKYHSSLSVVPESDNLPDLKGTGRKKSGVSTDLLLRCFIQALSAVILRVNG